MSKISNVKMPVTCTEKELLKKVSKISGIPENKIKHFKILKKSLDARDKNNIFYNFSVEVSNNRVAEEEKVYKKVKTQPSVLVVGAGPAGLFCALTLLRCGAKVLLIERGKAVEDRQKSVSDFISSGVLDENSNIQFGEGGAGAFSDGKLNTQVGGNYVKEVLNEFVKFGAPSEVAYLNKPHIGSDNLPKVIKNIRNEILALGGEIKFSTTLTDLEIVNGKVKRSYFGGGYEEFDEVVLAVGHSARDVYEMANRRNIFIESKDFAVGLRIEHLKDDINLAQYGEKYAQLKCMPTADYKLTSNYQGRGVFTFCMCPGGFVMPSSSSSETVVVNGMSNYSRNNINSNSALVVQVSKKDFGEDVFGGVNFQQKMERLAFDLGGGDYKAPCILTGDYLKGNRSSGFGKVEPSYQMGVKKADLNLLFSKEINDAIKYAITDMAKRLKSFDSYDSVLTGVESRTSSPIKITRNENLASISASNLYPCGEGCGYAGGITSACIDGIKVAEKIVEKYR